MKNIATIAILLVATCFGATTAMAQYDRISVKVPFSFTVGSARLPAGTYTISAVDNSSVIKFSNLSHTGAALAMSQAANGKATPVGTVTFHKLGNQYFLSDVRGQADSVALHFPTSKAEKRAKALIADANLPNDNTVLVALL